MGKAKYWAVKAGRKPGIYEDKELAKAPEPFFLQSPEEQLLRTEEKHLLFDGTAAVAYCDGSWKNGRCGWGVTFSFCGETFEASGSFREPEEVNLCCIAGGGSFGRPRRRPGSPLITGRGRLIFIMISAALKDTSCAT